MEDKRRRKRMSREKKRRLCGYVFLSPWLIGFPLFMLFPLFSNLVLSFGKITEVIGLKISFVGWTNYRRLFVESTEFLPAFINTLKITLLWTPFIVVFGLLMAILLNQKMPLKGFFRVIFFMPVLLGSGYIMQQLSPAASVLLVPESAQEMLYYYFNNDIADFMAELLEQILAVFWKSGVQIVIFLSGLQSIPESYYEAARVDNANSWDCFWKITLPMISPVILLNTVYTVIDTFRDTKNEIADLVVRVIFNDANYEYGAAMGWVYFVATSLVVGLIFLIARRFVIYER